MIVKLIVFLLFLFPAAAIAQGIVNDSITLVRYDSCRFEGISVVNGKSYFTGEGRADSHVVFQIAGKDVKCDYAVFSLTEVTAYNAVLISHSVAFPCEIRSTLFKLDLNGNVAVFDGNVSFCNATGAPLTAKELTIDLTTFSYKTR